MQPIYRFMKYFSDFELPMDDFAGITNMYGKPESGKKITDKKFNKSRKTSSGPVFI